MATNVGSVSVRVVPDATQFVRDLRRDLDSPADRLGKELGKKLGAEAAGGVNDALRDALGDIDSSDIKRSGNKLGGSLGDALSKGVGAGFQKGVSDARKQLDSELSGFAREVNKRVTGALNSLPSSRTVSFGVNTSELQKALTMLRSLQSKRVGVEIETGRAIADANRIIEKLREIDRTQTRAEVRADIQNAIRELESLRRYAAKAGDDSGRDYGGAFERTVRGALQRAGSSINIRPEFDGSEVNNGLANIQRQMASLRDKRIGVDIDAAGFESEFANIRSKLAQLSNQSADINVRADASAALAELYAVNDYLEKLDGKTARANVTVDDGGTAYAVDTSISRLLNRLLLFGSAAGGISSVVGPLLALGAAAGVAGAAVGAAALSFGGIGDAVKALGEQQKETAKTGQDLAAKQAQQAGQIANAQARVAQATRNAGNVREQVAAQAARAAAAVRDAEQRVTQAREKAAADDAKAAAAVLSAQNRVAKARRDAADNAAESAARIAKAQQGVAKAEQTMRDNAEQSAIKISEARAKISQASEDAAERVRAALDRAEKAETDLGRAQRDARKAQEDLTEARERARRGLLDMRDAVAGNVLSQRRNALDLIEAEQELAKVRSDPTATDLQRARAQLAYDEAVQQSRELRREGQELGADYAEASRKGVNGSDEVVSAQERVQDAIGAVGAAQAEIAEANREVDKARRDGARDVAKAQAELAQAEREAATQRRDDLAAIADAQAAVGEAQAAAAKQARDDAESIAEAQASVREAEAARAQQSRDSARQIRDAEEALADARRNQAEQARQGANQILEADENVKDAQRQLQQAYITTGDEGKKAADKVAEAFANLSPAAADFARYLFSLQPLLRSLQATSASAFLPDLTRGMNNFLTNFESFEGTIGRLAGSAGVFAERLLTKLADQRWARFWQEISYAADGIAYRAADSFDKAGWAVGQFWQALLPTSSVGFDALDAVSQFFEDLAPFAPQIAVPLAQAFVDMLRNLTPLGPALAALAPLMAELGRILSLGVGAALIALVPAFEALGVVLGIFADVIQLIPEPLRAIAVALIALQLAKVIFSDMRLASRFAKDSLTDLSSSAGTLTGNMAMMQNQTSKASAALLRGGSAASVANKAILNYGGASGVARMSAVDLGAEQDRLSGKIRAQGRQWLGLRAAVLAQVEATRWARSAWQEVQAAYARGSTGGMVADPNADGGQRLRNADEVRARIEENNRRIAESSARAGDAIRRVPDRVGSAFSAMGRMMDSGFAGIQRADQMVNRAAGRMVGALGDAASAAGTAGRRIGGQLADGLNAGARSLGQFGERVRDGVTRALGPAMLATGAFTEHVRQSFRQATESPEAFRQALTRTMDRIDNTVANAGARFGEFRDRVGDAVGQARIRVGLEAQEMGRRLAQVATDAASSARDMGRNFVDGARDMATRARTQFESLRNSVETSAVRSAMAWNDAAGRISRYFQNLTTDVGTYRDAAGRLRDENGRFAREAAQSGETVRNVFRNLAADAQVAVNRVGAEVDNAGARMAAGWGRARDSTVQAMGNIRTAVTDGATAVGGAIQRMSTQGWDGFRQGLVGMRDSAVSGMGQIRQAISTGVDNSVAALGRLRDIGAGGIRTSIDGIASAARTAFTGLGTAVENGVAGARRSIQSLGDMAGGAARGGLTALRTVLMGTTTGGGLIGALGGGWGIAIMGVVTALGFLADSQQKNAQRAAEHRTAIDNLKGSLDQYTGAVTQATIEQKANEIATGNLDDIARGFGINLGDLTRAMLGQDDALARVNRQLMEQARQTVEGSGAWRGYQEQLQANGLSMDVLQQAALGNQDAIARVQRAIDVAGGSSSDFGLALQGLLGDFEDNSRGLQQLGQAVGQSNNDLRTAQTEHLNARAAIDGMRTALEGARGQMVFWSQELNNTNGNFTAIGPNADAFREQLRGISGTARDAALAAGELADRNNVLGGSATGVRDSLAQSRGEFIRNAEAAGISRQAAENLATQYGLIPDIVTTQFNALGVRQADEALGILQGKITSVDQTTGTIRIDGGLAQAEIARLEHLGFTVRTLPGGRVEVTSNIGQVEASIQGVVGRINQTTARLGLQADPLPANATLQQTVDRINQSRAWAKIEGDPLPANATTQQTLDWINRQWGFLNEAANTRPAEDGTRGTIQWINGAWAFVPVGANDHSRPVVDPLRGHAGAPVTMPVHADDSQARGVLGNFFSYLQGQVDDFARAMGMDGLRRLLGLDPVVTPPPPPAPPRARWGGPGARALGSIDHIRGMAAGGVRGMAAGYANVVAPNTPTLIGDRKKDDEAYIPINSSSRSQAILEETARRMGYGLTPMAAGGILAMAAGGVVGSAGAAAPAAASTASTAALPSAADVAALNTALAALNVTLAATQAAVTAVDLALATLNLTAQAMVAGLAAADLALVALNANSVLLNTALVTLNVSATALGTTINSLVIPALTTEAAVVTAQTIPAYTTLGGVINAQVIPALTNEANTLNALVTPAYSTHALALTTQVTPALTTLAAVVNAQVIPALTNEANTLNALVTPAFAANALAVNVQVIPAYTMLTGAVNAQVIPAFTSLTNTVSFMVTPALVALANQINIGNVPALAALATQINTVTVPALSLLTSTVNFQVNPSLLAMQNQINLGNIPALNAFGLSTNTLINTALLPLNTNLTTILFPTLQRYQFEIGTLCVQSNQALQDSLGRLRVDMDITSQNVAVNMQRNRDEMHRTAFEGGVAMDSLRNNMRLTQDAAKFMADLMFAEMGRIRGAVADPIRWTMQFPLGPPGIAASWNALDDQFKLGKRINPPAPNFRTGGTIGEYASGGRISGTGSGTQDNIPIMASTGEFVVREKIARQHKGFLNALNSGQPEARQAAGGSRARMATGGVVGKRPTKNGLPAYAPGGVIEAVERARAFANAQAGKPYVWAAAGPGGYDCSGYMSAITNVLRGQAPYRRLGATGTFPWGGFAPGLTSGFAIGSTPNAGSGIGHMAGTLGGMNVESRGGRGVINGPGARGSDNALFTMRASLQQVGGQFVSGGAGGAGGGGFDPTPVINEKFANTYKLIDEIVPRFGNSPFVTGIQGIARQGADAVKGKATEQLMQMFGTAGGGGPLGPLGAGAQFYVAEISRAAKAMGLGKDAAIIGVATALVETGNLRMLANRARPDSLRFPHDGVAADHDSVGLFQQRANGAWGTTAQQMNAFASASMFFGALARLPWRSMAPGDAAQAVQRSAFPGKYATRMAEATRYVNQWGGFDEGGVATGMGFMPKFINEPERVLSPQQTRSFDTLVHAISEKDLIKAMAAPQSQEPARVFNVYPRENQSEMSIASAVRRIDSFQSRLR